MNKDEPDPERNDSAQQRANDVPRLVRPEIAMRYRLRALCLSWSSSALWKAHDAEMTVDAAEKLACRLEAQAIESCVAHLEQACRDWPNA